MKTAHYYHQLFLEGCKINIQRMKLYFPSLFIELLSNLLFVSTVLIFWNVIYETFPNNKIGLTKNELYVYLAFVEIFVCLKTSFTYSTGKLWRVIYSGQLLSFMIRPVHPIVFFLLNSVRLHMLIPPFPIICYLLYQGKAEWTWFSLFLGLCVVVIALILVSLMELSFSLLSLWMTKMNALDEIVDSFMNFTKYPLTIFNYGWQLIFTIIFPFTFYVTAPSFVALSGQMVEMKTWIYGFICLILWGGMLIILWKKGLKRYDGYGG